MNISKVNIKKKGGVRNVKWSWVENGWKIQAKIVSNDTSCLGSSLGYWNLNPRWGEWLKDSWCPSNTHLIGGWCWGGVESSYDTDSLYQGGCQEESSGGIDNNQHNPGHHWEEQHHLCQEVGGNTWSDRPLVRGAPSSEEPGGRSRGSVGSPINHPPVLPKYYKQAGGDCHKVDCISY